MSRYFFVFLSFLSFLFYSDTLFAMEEDIEVRSWVPTRLQKNSEQIKSLISNEKKVATKLDDPKERRDFGFSAPGLDPLKVQCLSKIKEKYEKNMVRPAILDVGAGHGLMSLKMIIAGGYVTALEKQKATALELQKTLGKVKPFLRDDENFKSVCKLVVDDALNLKNNLAYKADNFYISWSGLLLHFFTPNQAEEYVRNLFNITSDGGYAFATVNPPCTDPKIVSFYTKQEEEGSNYPGYFAINKKITSTYSAQTDTQQDIPKIVSIEAIKPDNVSLPGQVKYGVYGKETSKIQHDVLFRNQEKTIAEHDEFTIKHFIGPKVLTRLFEKPGFKIESLYYISADGQIPIDKMSDELLSQETYFLAIMARKPVLDKAYK